MPDAGAHPRSDRVVVRIDSRAFRVLRAVHAAAQRALTMPTGRQGVSDPAGRDQDRRRGSEVGSLTPWLRYRDQNSGRQRPPPVNSRDLSGYDLQHQARESITRDAAAFRQAACRALFGREDVQTRGKRLPRVLFVCLFHHSTAVHDGQPGQNHACERRREGAIEVRTNSDGSIEEEGWPLLRICVRAQGRR